MGASRQKDHLLLGSREGATVDLFTLHPDPVGVFRLWDIYLKNVDPLLKITHRPSLQPLLVEATCDTAHIRPALEALMFGIYSIAVLSLSHDECAAIFNTPKEELQKRYHFACQEALINADFLRTTDRTCLTALYFYLVRIIYRIICRRVLIRPTDIDSLHHRPLLRIFVARNRISHCPAVGSRQ